MPNVRIVLGAAVIGLGLLAASAQSETLPLPGNLIDLRSDRGELLLHESDAFDGFVPLIVNFVTQKNQAFCGVASIVMVLNAMELPAPRLRNTIRIVRLHKTIF